MISISDFLSASRKTQYFDQDLIQLLKFALMRKFVCLVKFLPFKLISALTFFGKQKARGKAGLSKNKNDSPAYSYEKIQNIYH